MCPQLQIMPQPSTRTRRHRSSEHGQHRRRQPGPAAAQDTQPRLVRTPQPAPKLALARPSHVCDSCPVSDPPGHRPCFRWLLGRQSRRLPGSADGLGGRAGSTRAHVQPEARLGATPPRASPAVQRARTPAAQRPRRATCRLREASQAAQGPPSHLGRGQGRSGRLIRTRMVGRSIMRRTQPHNTRPRRF